MIAVHPFAMDSMLLDVAAHPFDLLHGAGFARRVREAPRLTRAEDGSVSVTLAAPGIKAEDLKVEVEDGMLKVAGETGTRSIRWATRLPRDADGEKTTASTENGLVMVTIPRKPKTEPTLITVKTTLEEDDEDDEDGEDDDQYTLTLPIPGVAAADITITADHDESVLTIKGETARTGARVAEITRLPRDADATLATATHVDGILTLSVPKKAPVALEVKKSVDVQKAELAAAPAAAAEEDAMAE